MKDTPNNFLGIPPQHSSYGKAAIVILPVPYDLTSSYVKGADLGPAACIEASKNVELYDIETRSETYLRGIHTAEPIGGSSSDELNNGVYSAVKRCLADGKFVVTLGGEHSISYGPIKAHAEKHPRMSILQLDAHSDLRDEYEGNPHNHACIMARAGEIVDNIVAVGIRSQDRDELKRAKPGKMFYAEDLIGHRRMQGDWMEEVLAQLGDEVYVTIDLDVFEIGLMPSTGTPEPGGLGWYDVIGLLRRVAETRKIVGFDVVELCPGENKAPDFLAARLVYKLLAYCFSLKA